MRPIKNFLKIIIALLMISEIFVLFTIVSIIKNESEGGDIVTFAQDTPFNGQNLSAGTYVVKHEGLVKLDNYWIYKSKIITILVPLILLIILFIILKMLNKKYNINKINRLQDGTEISGQIVEDIVQKLRADPPPKSLGWVILFGDRPLAVNLEGECILCFSNKSKSKYFMAKYQETYYCTRPLSALSTGNINELWALLNNKSNDPDYKTPYGLIINFNYEGQQYHKYTKTDLKKIGINGLEKGLSALLQEKKSTTENDNNIATTTVQSSKSQPKQPRQTTDQQSLEPLLWENYCLFCDEYESGIGVCSKIHENVRSYPKKFINKCNGKFFKKI